MKEPDPYSGPRELLKTKKPLKKFLVNTELVNENRYLCNSYVWMLFMVTEGKK